MKYIIRKILKEEADGFDWVRDYDSLDGIRFTIPVMGDRTVYTIRDKGGPHVKVSFDSETENEFNKYFKARKHILFHRVKAEEHFWNKLWVMVPKDIKESDDIQWINDEPGIGVGFCYSYYVDEPLTIVRIRAHRKISKFPFTEFDDVESIDELNPDEFEDAIVYYRNGKSGFIESMYLERLIKNLTQGKFHPC